ncbi:hypothetical protein EI94DRAFT_1709234 [Lactarius quietus]|nr:hypothetical protein EI94DRAFT_1709234 [Lactarius quietus]
MNLADHPNGFPPDANVYEVAEEQFQEHYLHLLGDNVCFVRLQKMHRENACCNDLIEKTAVALNDDVVSLMLLAVQRSNLELSVKTSLNSVHSCAGFEVKRTVRECLGPFPYLWASLPYLTHVGALLFSFLLIMPVLDILGRSGWLLCSLPEEQLPDETHPWLC